MYAPHNFHFVRTLCGFEGDVSLVEAEIGAIALGGG
jgi:hypothetical protein